MKRILAIIIICSLLLTSCGVLSNKNEVLSTESQGDVSLDVTEMIQSDSISFESLSDPKLLTYVEETIYTELVSTLNNEGYFVENIEAVYISKEYLEEVAYNSQSNIYFGFTLDELNELFEDEKYVFTLGEDGTTTVKVSNEYTDIYESVLKNVVTGTGLILICVTVSVLTGGTAPAVSLIFAASAKTGTAMALSSGVFSTVAAGVITGIGTKDFETTMMSMALAGSEGFKWGAFSGVLAGGITETIALKGATLNGLTMNQAADIQMESKYPLDVIKQFKTVEQYEICKSAELKPVVVNGKTALIRKIDLDYVDEATGLTNLELMKGGYAAIDPVTGKKYQLHHIGQKVDSTLAILTESEHTLGGNNTIWHDLSIKSEVHTSKNNWDTQRKQFWKSMAKILTEGEG